MTWLKIDDQFPDHPKVVAAGPLAAWLNVCGMAYCARYLTDGFVPAGQVARLADIDDPKAAAQTLVDVGLWHEVQGGYEIHDFLEYNPSAESIRQSRTQRSEAGSLGGKRSAERRHIKEANTQGSAQAGASASATPFASDMFEAKSNPVPVPRPLVNVVDAHEELSDEDLVPPSTVAYGLADDRDEEGKLYQALEPYLDHNNNAEAERRLFMLCKDILAGEFGSDLDALEATKDWYRVRRPRIDTETGRVTSLRGHLVARKNDREKPPQVTSQYNGHSHYRESGTGWHVVTEEELQWAVQ